MTPDQFIAKWQASTLKERSVAQEHFIDLCRLLNEPTPAEVDPIGVFYCFERGAKKPLVAMVRRMYGNAIALAGNTKANVKT